MNRRLEAKARSEYKKQNEIHYNFKSLVNVKMGSG